MNWFTRLFHKKVKIPAQYQGVICEVCGEKVKGGHKTEHYNEKHPEYSLDRIKIGTESVKYYCRTCKKRIGSVNQVVNHYKKYHSKV